MGSRRALVLLVVGAAALSGSCSLIYSLDGYDLGSGGARHDAGAQGGGGAATASGSSGGGHASSSIASSSSSSSTASSSGAPACKSDGSACTQSAHDCCSMLCCATSSPPDHCVTYPPPEPQACCGLGTSPPGNDNGTCGSDHNVYYCYEYSWFLKTSCVSMGKLCHVNQMGVADTCQ